MAVSSPDRLFALSRSQSRFLSPYAWADRAMTSFAVFGSYLFFFFRKRRYWLRSYCISLVRCFSIRSHSSPLTQWGVFVGIYFVRLVPFPSGPLLASTACLYLILGSNFHLSAFPLISSCTLTSRHQRVSLNAFCPSRGRRAFFSLFAYRPYQKLFSRRGSSSGARQQSPSFLRYCIWSLVS